MTFWDVFADLQATVETLLKTMHVATNKPGWRAVILFFRMFEENHVLLEQWERIKASGQLSTRELRTWRPCLGRQSWRILHYNNDVFHELLGTYATSQSICALDASLRWFLPCFYGRHPLYQTGFACSALVLLCVKCHSREYQDGGFPSTIHIIYFNFHGFNAAADLCFPISTQWNPYVKSNS